MCVPRSICRAVPSLRGPPARIGGPRRLGTALRDPLIHKINNMPAALLDKKEERIRRMFGDIAPRYDLLNHLLSFNVDKYWRRRTTKIVAPNGTDPILDVCTGT